MQRVRRVWAQRVEAEYRSAALSAELLHWLIATGVSPDTLEACHRVVADELAHAELSRDVLIAAGGTDEQVPIEQSALSFPLAAGQPVHARALLAVAQMFCCGETVAVPLFHAMLQAASAPEAVAALKRIEQDESMHRAFGWVALDELLEITGEPGRALLQSVVSGMVRDVGEAYSSTSTELTENHRAWGVLSGVTHGEIVRTCVADVIVPRFAERGLVVAGPSVVEVR